MLVVAFGDDGLAPPITYPRSDLKRGCCSRRVRRQLAPLPLGTADSVAPCFRASSCRSASALMPFSAPDRRSVGTALGFVAAQFTKGGGMDDLIADNFIASVPFLIVAGGDSLLRKLAGAVRLLMGLLKDGNATPAFPRPSPIAATRRLCQRTSASSARRAGGSMGVHVRAPHAFGRDSFHGPHFPRRFCGSGLSFWAGREAKLSELGVNMVGYGRE